MRTWVRSQASLSGLRIWRYCELWCKSQMWLGSCTAVAVAWAGGYSSDWTSTLGTSICLGCGPKKTKKKKNKKTKNKKNIKKKLKGSLIFSTTTHLCTQICQHFGVNAVFGG